MDNAVKMEGFIAGELVQQYQYKSFQPSLVNLQWNWESTEINVRLEKASRALAELNAFSLYGSITHISSGSICVPESSTKKS